MFHLCATIPLALQLAWLEDVGSTVGHNPIHRSISIFPLSLGRTEGRRGETVREGRTDCRFPGFCLFSPFFVLAARPPSDHLSFPLLSLPQSPLLPTSDAISTIVYRDPFRRSAAKRNSPRASEVMSPSPSLHPRRLLQRRPISGAMTNASSNQHGCFQEISSNGRLALQLPLLALQGC